MLRLPNSQRTVYAFLEANGPMTLSCLASFTGLSQARLRTHVRSHRDAFASTVVIGLDGIKLRVWRTTLWGMDPPGFDWRDCLS